MSIRDLIPARDEMGLCDKKLWTIGGGKGGVGKTFLAAAMGTALARAGRSVILVDANLAAPDLHAYLGIKAPGSTLLDVLERRAAIQDALMATPEPNLYFLSCVGDELGMSEITRAEQENMVACLSALDAEFVLLDVGSGTSLEVLDFFNLAHEAIVVTSPDPASMRCTFKYIRNAAYRRVQDRFGGLEDVKDAFQRLRRTSGTAQPQTMKTFLDLLRPNAPEAAQNIANMLEGWRPHLLVNMAASEQDHHVADIILSAVRRFLNIDLHSCGVINFDPAWQKSNQVVNLTDFTGSDQPLAVQVRQTALRLASADPSGLAAEPQGVSAPAQSATAMGLNDNLAIMGRALHVQTEDLGVPGQCITTQVFCDGRVILSTKSEYPPEMREAQHNDELVELMRNQHFNIIRQIENKSVRHQSELS
jgi:flagellar biosynthesis protein FlhG